MEYLTTEQELKVMTDRLETQIKINEKLNKENLDLMDDVIDWMQDFQNIGRLMGLRGSKVPNVEDIEKSIKELMEDRDELKRWKEEMLQVESEWDCQRVGKLLNIAPGEPIRNNIEPKIRQLIAEKDDLWDRIMFGTITYTD
jgi:hypothetical protein